MMIREQLGIDRLTGGASKYCLSSNTVFCFLSSSCNSSTDSAISTLVTPAIFAR
ncbi:MAG: hypothetical protein RM338_16965 [Nostoc sp. DedQUE12a]|nr:hypothetical protein [Nostoc sp. DedQUE12a]